MHQRPALQAGEHRRVDLLAEFLVVGEDEAAARAAQRLVRGRGHDMGVRERARMRAAGDEAGEMRHVDHQLGADAVGDLAEGAEVDDARIGRAAGDDHLRLVLLRKLAHLVHVDAVVVAAHAIRHRLEPLARHVDRRAVAEMAAGGEVQARGRCRPAASARRTPRRWRTRRSAAARWHSSAPNSFFTRSMASVSAMSTNWQPP